MTIMNINESEQAAVGISTGGSNIILKNGAIPTLRTDGWGVGFGPLRIDPYESTTVVIDDLGFEALDRYSLPFLDATTGVSAAALGGLPVLATVDDETETRLTRRDALLAAGTLIGAGVASTGTAAAQEDSTDDTTRTVAEFELAESPRGIQLGIDDMVGSYLPPDSEYYVEIDGDIKGSFTPGADGGEGSLTTGPQITGTVRVVSKDGVAFWKRILAKISGNEPLTYTFRTDKPLSAYDRGEEVLINDQPLVVDAIQSAEPDETILRAGGETVAHLDDGSDSFGNWYLRDTAALVYQVGVDSPETTSIELKINASTLERIESELLG